jgi:hypothetical protein
MTTSSRATKVRGTAGASPHCPTANPWGSSSRPRNNHNPIIAYIGVLPAQRGNGYIDDLLAEGTRILAAHDGASVPIGRIRENFERQITMT